jgi:hypothetical protein
MFNEDFLKALSDIDINADYSTNSVAVMPLTQQDIERAIYLLEKERNNCLYSFRPEVRWGIKSHDSHILISGIES